MITNSSVSIFDSENVFEGGKRTGKSPKRKRKNQDIGDSPSKVKTLKAGRKKATYDFAKLEGLDKITFSPEKILSAKGLRERDGVSNV